MVFPGFKMILSTMILSILLPFILTNPIQVFQRPLKSHNSFDPAISWLEAPSGRSSLTAQESTIPEFHGIIVNSFIIGVCFT